MALISFRNLLFVSQCTHTIVKRAMATSVKFTRITPTPTDDGMSPLSRSSHGISYLNSGKLVIYGGEHVARTPIEDSSQSLWLAEKSSDNVWKWINPKQEDEGDETCIVPVREILISCVFTFVLDTYEMTANQYMFPDKTKAMESCSFSSSCRGYSVYLWRENRSRYE